MLAARLYGARDLRVEQVPSPGQPKPGQVLIDVTAVGICGSDLHSYVDGRIGSTDVAAPLILGHEFGGIVRAVGDDARDGDDHPLRIGQRVAIDPATPCWHCEFCDAGHPNLCRRLHFCGLFPDDGSLCQHMIVEGRGCFPVPDTISDAGSALLEPLGVALHAVDLAKIRLQNTVVVIGCGPIGLLLIKLARLNGAGAIYAFDPHEWRVANALQWGATAAFNIDSDPVKRVAELTQGRGADIVIEAAWGGETIGQAAEMARLGGRVVLVGIPSDDQIVMRHSTARRKGLTIVLSRRMKHTYPRAIRLVESGALNLDALVSHHFPLEQADQAFALNARYGDRVNKIVIDIRQG
ncbi:MAG: alcohol dehydrogenase catalytic domain-containing protein [Anaerolineae bacterium]